MMRRQSCCVIDLDDSLIIAYRPRYEFAPKAGKASERRNLIPAVSGLRFAVHSQEIHGGRSGLLQIGSDEAQICDPNSRDVMHRRLKDEDERCRC